MDERHTFGCGKTLPPPVNSVGGAPTSRSGSPQGAPARQQWCLPYHVRATYWLPRPWLCLALIITGNWGINQQLGELGVFQISFSSLWGKTCRKINRIVVRLHLMNRGIAFYSLFASLWWRNNNSPCRSFPPQWQQLTEVGLSQISSDPIFSEHDHLLKDLSVSWI